jgi:hypothetical protein
LKIKYGYFTTRYSSREIYSSCVATPDPDIECENRYTELTSSDYSATFRRPPGLLSAGYARIAHLVEGLLSHPLASNSTVDKLETGHKEWKKEGNK